MEISIEFQGVRMFVVADYFPEEAVRLDCPMEDADEGRPELFEIRKVLVDKGDISSWLTDDKFEDLTNMCLEHIHRSRS